MLGSMELPRQCLATLGRGGRSGSSPGWKFGRAPDDGGTLCSTASCVVPERCHELLGAATFAEASGIGPVWLLPLLLLMIPEDIRLCRSAPGKRTRRVGAAGLSGSRLETSSCQRHKEMGTEVRRLGAWGLDENGPNSRRLLMTPQLRMSLFPVCWPLGLFCFVVLG